MLARLFNPRSVAIVGASRDPSKIGHAILRNMIDSGYKGEIYPVNPSSPDILGFRCYPTLSDVPSIPELVVIALPAHRALEGVQAGVDLGVEYIILIAGGFSETGVEGKEREDYLRSMIKGKKTRIIGPNTLGIYLPETGVNTALTSGGRVTFPPGGNIAFLSQSGALGLLTMDGISDYSIGVSCFVNLGNRLDLNEIELMDYLVGDSRTGSIVIYVESIPEGREFFRKVKEVTRRKPVVILKAGRTEESAKAASLHTGAMASNDAIIDGAVSQSGAVRAYSETELIDYGRILAYSGPLLGDRIAVVTTAGGVGVVTADYISSDRFGVGMRLSELSENTVRSIRKVVVPFASAGNPVDLTADGSVEDFDKVLGILLNDKNVDGIIAYPLPQTPKMGIRAVDVIEKYVKGKKPVVVGMLGSKMAKNLIIEFERKKIPAYPSIERTVKAVKALRDYSAYLQRRGLV